MFIDMDHRAPNCQQLINIYLLNIEAWVYSDSLHCGNAFIPDYAAFSYSTREDREQGSQNNSRLGVFRMGYACLGYGRKLRVLVRK